MGLLSQVLQWRRRAKLIILEPTDSKKQEIKGVEETTELDTVKLIEPPKEAKVTTLEEHPEVAEAYVLAKTMDETVDETELELGPEPRSLLRLPQTAVQSVSRLMLSALQSGWQMCRWKVSISSPSPTPRDLFFPPHTCSTFLVPPLWPGMEDTIVDKIYPDLGWDHRKDHEH